MNNTNSTLFITFISLLTLNMLLIFFGVYSYFFDVTDYTIIAGIIGFFGAIIGGYLTWRGVEYNIEHQKVKDRYMKLPDEIKKCWKLNKCLSYGYFLGSATKEKSIDEIHKMVMEFYNETEEVATELSLDISFEMYKITMRYYTLLTDYTVYIKRNEIDYFIKQMEEIYIKSHDVLQSYENEYEDLTKKFNVKV